MMGKRDEAKEIWIRETAVTVWNKHGKTPQLRKFIAKQLGVTPPTIARWAKRVAEGKPVYTAPGRKPKEVPREERQAVVRDLIALGPFAGVAVLRGRRRSVPFRQLARMKRRFVAVLKRRYRWYQRRLKWLRAGSVWAADFTKPSARLWGDNERLLLVRDLASGATLAAVACRTETKTVACATFLALFVAFGAPLVLKLDNGSAFIAGDTKRLLAAYAVQPLYSPPRTPQFNGSCERAGGCFKQRVEHEALLCGHPGVWTPRNVDRAMRVANTTARPRGSNGLTPAQAFDARAVVSTEERRAFLQSLRAEIARELQKFRKENGRMPTCSQHAAIDRRATQRALQEHGYLKFRRGRLSTLISTWRAVANA